MKFATLYKKASTGKIVEWELELEGDKYRSITGQQGGKKIINEWTTCKGKNIGRSNATTPEQQAISEANAKWKKQTEKHYVENLEDIDNETFVKVMLATTYEKVKAKMSFEESYSSPKLDGLRFVASKNSSHSRSGKQLGGMNLIRKEMDRLFEEHPEIVTDGEGYSHTYKDKFNEIVSLIKRDESKITDEKKVEILNILNYHIYDVLAIGRLTAKDPYIERFEAFWTLIDSNYPELKRWLKKVPYEPVSSHEDIQTKFEQHIADGYEGSIIRYDRGYENKRSKFLIKVKLFEDEEFEIIEILEGKGGRSNMAGRIRVKDSNGVEFKSGIKGGVKFYKELWADKNNLKCKSATIRYFGKNPDTGVPRFPVCVQVDRENVE